MLGGAEGAGVAGGGEEALALGGCFSEDLIVDKHGAVEVGEDLALAEGGAAGLRRRRRCPAAEFEREVGVGERRCVVDVEVLHGLPAMPVEYWVSRSHSSAPEVSVLATPTGTTL